MKRKIAIGFVTTLMLSACVTNNIAAETKAADDFTSLREAYADIEPLTDPATIRYIGTIGLQLSAPIWLAYESGGLEDAGITLDFTPASTGPLSIEALTAGEVDLVGTGIGGIAVGTIQGTAKMLCYINSEASVQKFYVAGDSPLAEAEYNEETGFYGTAEDWKGREVYMPAGTTLQYLMGYSLDKLGLSLQDITPVYMEANNVNTAMYAGKGEVWGIWNYLCYAASVEENGFVPVIEGDDVGIYLMTAYCTNDKVLDDPVKQAAIKKILEYHFATIEWMKESEENMYFASEVMQRWCEEEGMDITADEMYRYMSDSTFFGLSENIEMWTEEVTNDHGTMIKALDDLQGIMDFYIEQGNYTEDDRTAMIENQNELFDVEFLNAIGQ